MNGLLVDLELDGPDPSRYRELRDAFTRRLPQEVPAVSNFRVTLEYEHFAALDRAFFDSHRVDFILLSPQSTPWHMYRGDAADKLRRLGDLLKDLALGQNRSVLGICGGHQFLALAFGGRLGFIDPKLDEIPPERYPKGALSERGVVILETVKDDPIFDGLVVHPGRFRVVESHYEEVKEIPPPFVNLAKSETSAIQLMRIPGKTVYGVAFHPERGWDPAGDPASFSPDGRLILANFLRMVPLN
ncbi:MAG: gamma-glutamyl-gamma-aminobutyrate hydrolase family protein [Desulfomonile tiedjei]|nr:gamma-glutamyl-gamma-aminobutyrate hydrolase family protein [Desulfomonile tiedjei]